MRDKVPGMDVPEEVITRLERTTADRQPEEGLKIAAEIVAALRDMRGVAGVHLIAVKWEEGIARLIEETGLRRSAPAPFHPTPETGAEVA
jgi:methylenetetrahydrofolate reductase (NADPH)